MLIQCYTVGRNGRLNAWECDTRLDGLVKREPTEQDMDVDNEDVTNGLKSNKDKDDLEESVEADDVKVSSASIEESNENKRFYISFKKRAK